jgi:hypothetical protein
MVLLSRWGNDYFCHPPERKWKCLFCSNFFSSLVSDKPIPTFLFRLFIVSD